MRMLAALVLCWAASAGAAFAQAHVPSPQAQPEAIASVYACAQIHQDAQRLACYDAAVAHLQQAQEQGQVVAVDRQQAETIQRDAFGFHLPSLSRMLPSLRGAESGEVTNVHAAVSRVTGGPSEIHRFYLDNGQTWIQVEPGAVRNVQPGDTVTVQRAALGSFRLIGSRGGLGYRVRREE